MFVDTSAWVALAVKTDASHAAAKKLLEQADPAEGFITTDYVFDETVTRVRRLAGHRVAVHAGQLLKASTLVRILPVTTEDFGRAWEIFQKHSDKDLSFTDCTSAALMERLKMRTVFAFDDDFRRLGFTMRP